ncbi:alkaline phosphatase D family protein [Ornithinicoccus hortensis]|uniref:Phosphodiesterase/alkaline phosphatase D-like protein n=2 Tax=Ornithinicoccus hortensis TaxID=82346 RepID=A0A542YNS6_9MICO|nr:phosphodiesterase/alkaline phosphatase D-like protein [Ornithinicoccus hortensis]
MVAWEAPTVGWQTAVMSSSLVLGPMLRHTDTTSAAVWVETRRAAQVSVHAGTDEDGSPRVWRAPTFRVHGHHYALVEVTGLRPGERTAYRVEVDGAPAWPPPDDPFPPAELHTLTGDEEVNLAFGSCRTSVPHDRAHHLTHGVDALRTLALAVAGGERPDVGVPDLLLLLGDQVYADATSEAMQEFIASRRSLDEEPGTELADYAEYAHLYSLAWSEPALRWLFSWLPSLMIFDDHDVRDDWNTSVQWREEMEATSWWHGRIVAALASYWVYQHLGNLSVAERAEDEMWRELLTRRELAGADVEVDLTDVLDAFAERVDKHPETYRWSYARRLGDARLVVIDSRAARKLEPGRRSMLDEAEMAWLDEQVRGDCSHLVIGTSLPYLLPQGLHHLESWNEAVVDGGWGRRLVGVGERLRTAFDLEHWGAFTDGFERVGRMVQEVADGQRGAAPGSVLFLSGDVHHSYISEVDRSGGSRVLQLVCSPIRNPLPRVLRTATAVLARGIARPAARGLARSAGVARPPFAWHTVAGPWFDNNIALLRVEQDRLSTSWLTGEVRHGDHDHPILQVAADVELDVPVPGPGALAGDPAVAHVHGRQQRP